MSKRTMIILVVLVIVLVVVPLGLLYKNYSSVKDNAVFVKDDSVFVGASNKFITYEEKVKKTLIGFEQLSVKANVTREVWRINPKFVNDSKSSEPAEVLVNATVEEESFVNGSPIYEVSKPLGIVFGDFSVDFDTKGCVVCGTKLFCLSKSDGWSDFRGNDYLCKDDEPVIRPGESYYVYDLVQKRELDRKSDVGVI